MSFYRDLFRSRQAIIEQQRSELFNQQIAMLSENRKRLALKAETIPLLKYRNSLVATLNQFIEKRTQLKQEWGTAYLTFTLWKKLKYPEKLETPELDSEIVKLTKYSQEFSGQYGSQARELDIHFSQLVRQGEERIELAYERAVMLIQQYKFKDVDDDLLTKAGWMAALSIPISVWEDFNKTQTIYETLRNVNGNFSQMSDSDIWWETLWMSSESLAGLTSLTKGAYFEQLVAADTGGQLFEHFNNPDTDIVIDGIEMQIKATNSVAYIASVNDEIPVIATTEVANKVGVIDGGHTNEELTNSVELALGGTVIDAKDTALDAIFIGGTSLGFFAAIRGINHASTRYEKGVEGIEAIIEGAVVAVEGTAKGIVDAGEMVYNAAKSKPSRFIGRQIKKGFVKLDNKMMEAGRNASVNTNVSRVNLDQELREALAKVATIRKKYSVDDNDFN
jgi:hypothetical protein